MTTSSSIMPEFLGDDCTPERLAEALLPLLPDGQARAAQLAAMGRLDALMRLESGSPSERAAAIVLRHAETPSS